MAAPLRAWPFKGQTLLAHWSSLVLPPLASTMAKAGFMEPDLLIMDSPALISLRRILNPKVTVARVLDDLRGFASTTPAIVEAERLLLRNADVTIVSGLPLAERARNLGAKDVRYFPHGVDLTAFEAVGEAPQDIANLPRPRILYVGAIDSWLDLDLILRAAQIEPDWSFIMVGPAAIATSALRQQANIHLLGWRPYDVVPTLMRSCDAGLIPFKNSEFTNSINPLKLCEYLAAGLPVIAARLKSIEATGAPALFYEPGNVESFLSALRRGLSEGANPAALEFLKGRSWTAVFDSIIEASQTHLRNIHKHHTADDAAGEPSTS